MDQVGPTEKVSSKPLLLTSMDSIDCILLCKTRNQLPSRIQTPLSLLLQLTLAKTDRFHLSQ